MQQADALTGFLAKEVIYDTLDKFKAESDRDNKPFTLLFLDMDRFRSYNEKYGHLEGDNVLKCFADTLRIAIPVKQVSVFRFGGDEFIIVFPNKKAREVYCIARGMLKILNKASFLVKGSPCKLLFSAGIATYPVDGRKIESLIHKADMAMYFSKTHGHARATIYSRMIWETLTRIICLVMCISLALGAVFYSNQNFYTDHARIWLKKKVGSIITNMSTLQVRMDSTAPQARIGSTDPVLVYLKSGRAVKGTIIRDDENEIELKLNFDVGRGTVTFKKSNIDRIDKSLKKYQ